MAKDGKPPQPPVQRKDVDLTQPAALSDNPPKMPREKVDERSPAAMMRAMGFDPTKHMTPLQFLVAVMNDDIDMIYRQEKKRERMREKGIGLNYRVECAKSAAKYMHMAMPSVQIQSNAEDEFGNKLAEAIASGNERVRTRRMIVETVERISPDMPLPDASYPEAFDPNKPMPHPSDIEGHIVEPNEMVEGLNPEGDMEYNPDDD